LTDRKIAANHNTVRRHVDAYLAPEGYTSLECAHDSEEAIARLEPTPFDVVLLDVMMPKVDGYQVLTWIKDQARLGDLPVIMISEQRGPLH
jgi:CheY-like chemotaxis protein